METNGLLFDEIDEGSVCPPFELYVDEQELAAFHRCVVSGPLRGPDGAVVNGASADRPERIPLPLFLLGTFRATKAAIPMPSGVVHAREKIELLAPAYLHERLRVQVRVKAKFRKHDKRFVVVDQTLERVEDGTVVIQIERTLLWPR